jgi:hypothetical protein
MRNFPLASTALLCAVLAPTCLAGGRQPGSLLVYTVQRSSPTFFTIVSVTNTNVTPQTPISFGGSTNVHFQYFNVIPNREDPFHPLGCQDFNRREFLTPADTISVLTACHNAFRPGGQEGYLVVSAEDPSLFQTAWSHNDLVGSEIVINASGSTYSINAIPFSAIPAAGMATDVNMNGRLDLDGMEYEQVPDILILDSFIGVAASQLAIVNLTGDARDHNTLYFSVWNDNEFPLSATLTFNCWFDQPLMNVAPLFGQAFLAALPNDPAELDINCNGFGDLETGWATIDSIDVSTAGGNFVANDGAILGSVTAGFLNGGRLLWESTLRNANNGSIFTP